MALYQRLDERQALQRSAREWLKIYREELQKAKPHGLGKDGRKKSDYPTPNVSNVATGRILDAGYELQMGPDGYEIIIGLPGYILALDKGVRGGRFQQERKKGSGIKGKSAFLHSLKNWVITRKIKSSETEALSLAFAIRRSIFNEGIAATNILSTVNQIFSEKYASLIADGFMIDMENAIIDNLQRLETKFNS